MNQRKFTFMNFKELYTRWPNQASNLKEKGVLVASDITQEWLLPWWLENYQNHNTMPVSFVDLGLSSTMKSWCKEKGNYIPLPIPDIFVAEKNLCPENLINLWEEKYGNHFWENRNAWFKKPLACLLSPYKKTLWIDSDCEVRGSLEPLFSMNLPPSGVLINKEYGEISEGGINSGVILFDHKSPLIEKWAMIAYENNALFPGDQDIFIELLKEYEVANLPLIYNSSRYHEDHANIVIKHWHGNHGKTIIQHQIQKKNLLLSGFLS
jgi:hypothetical protein